MAEMTITIPVSTIKPLYRNASGDSLVVEVQLDALRKLNKPETIDEVILQARIDYAAGDYQSFSGADELIRDLRA